MPGDSYSLSTLLNNAQSSIEVKGSVSMIGRQAPAIRAFVLGRGYHISACSGGRAQQPDQVHLAAHAQLGVDGRQVVADCARAHEELGRNGRDALAVEQAGEYR